MLVQNESALLSGVVVVGGFHVAGRQGEGLGEDFISDDQVVDAFLRAARQAQAERPRIGVTNAHEWATI